MHSERLHMRARYITLSDAYRQRVLSQFLRDMHIGRLHLPREHLHLWRCVLRTWNWYNVLWSSKMLSRLVPGVLHTDRAMLSTRHRMQS
jgi:hypothetical protein